MYVYAHTPVCFMRYPQDTGQLTLTIKKAKGLRTLGNSQLKSSGVLENLKKIKCPDYEFMGKKFICKPISHWIYIFE